METTRKTGEGLVCKRLVKYGFSVIERNYLKKWGEIDVIATKDRLIHFIEVKSVVKVSKMTNGYRPEDNVHELTIRRL